jgi:uncharacterized membrane protein YeaQ/YmgE (transglycosylase-associated protein family)
VLADGGLLGGIFALAGGALAVWFLLNLLGALIVGAVARFLLPGKDQVGWLPTLIVGFTGGFFANVVGHLAGWIPPGKNGGLLGSILGAMVLLAAYRVWKSTRPARNGKPNGPRFS